MKTRRKNVTVVLSQREAEMAVYACGALAKEHGGLTIAEAVAMERAGEIIRDAIVTALSKKPVRS